MDLDKYKSQLQALRDQIDAVDQELVALLKRRTAIVHKVGELKKAGGVRGSYVYPGREATMMRALIQQFSGGDYPPEAVEALWRTLIGVATSLESPLKLCVLTPTGFAQTRYSAREYFGKHVPETETRHPSDLIAALKADPHVIGIVPPAGFVQQAGEPWWVALVNARLSAKVFAMMPFVQRKKQDAEMRCLAVADVPIEQTGQDISLLVARFRAPAPLDIETWCNHAILDCGLPAGTITVQEDAALLEINGFLPEDSPAFNSLKYKLSQHSKDQFASLHWIGAYATPWFLPDESSYA